jgi:hypothetical protein
MRWVVYITATQSTRWCSWRDDERERRRPDDRRPTRPLENLSASMSEQIAKACSWSCCTWLSWLAISSAVVNFKSEMHIGSTEKTTQPHERKLSMAVLLSGKFM